MYIIRDREAGNIIEEATTREEAKAIVKAYEEEDMNDGNYEEDFYEIVEAGYFVVDSRKDATWGDDKPYDTLEEALGEAEAQWSHLTRKEQKDRLEFYICFGTVDEEGCLNHTYRVLRDYKEEM